MTDLHMTDLHMTIEAAWIHVDAERAAECLQREAVERVNGAEGEVVLDFSSVLRIDPQAIGAMEALAVLAAARSVKLVLRGVNMDIYRVLKVLKLAQRFTFPA